VKEVLDAAKAVAWRQAHTFFTNPSFLLPSLLFPLFFFTAFVGGLARIRQVPGFDFPLGYTAFQFVFVLLQSAAFSGVFTGFGIARDFESGFMRRLMLAAPKRSGIVLGYAVAGLIRWLTVITVVTGVAFLARMKIGGDGVDLFGLYALGFLLSIAGTLWSTGVATRLRTQQAFRVDPCSRERQPDHGADGSGPRSHLRAPGAHAGRVRDRLGPDRRLRPLGNPGPETCGGCGSRIMSC